MATKMLYKLLEVHLCGLLCKLRSVYYAKLLANASLELIFFYITVLLVTVIIFQMQLS